RPSHQCNIMPDGNENIRISVEDFARRIRARYPGAYDDLPDAELAERVIRKYPVYADWVDLAPSRFSSRSLTAMPVEDQRLNVAPLSPPARSTPFPAPIARVLVNRPAAAPPNSTFLGQPRPPQAAELQYTRPFDREQQPLAPPAVTALHELANA